MPTGREEAPQGPEEVASPPGAARAERLFVGVEGLVKAAQATGDAVQRG